VGESTAADMGQAGPGQATPRLCCCCCCCCCCTRVSRQSTPCNLPTEPHIARPPASVTNWNLYPSLPSSCWKVAICSLLRFFSQLKEGEQL
jgi:hypothetical protein